MIEIAKILCKEVERQGVIPFVEFMRMALYCPKFGYYDQRQDSIGPGGDFYTSVSIGSLFGELLAFQCAEWLRELPGKAFQLVEAGAHDGRLAADILGWLSQNRPRLLPLVEYCIIEPSPRRQAWQKARLEQFADRVQWFGSLGPLCNGARTPRPRGPIQPQHADEASALRHELALTPLGSSSVLPDKSGVPAARHLRSVRGVIFSNELLDAMPVHRLGWDAAAGRWFEWGVTLATNHKFAWKKMPREADGLAAELRQAGLELPPEVQAVLPDGFTIEICPAAAAWWWEAALALKQGRLLTIDYGFPAEQFFAPERTRGTLRAYHHHHSIADVLAQPGEQDLTAHVNFTQLRRAGEEAGLSTEGLVSQEAFFTRLAAKTWQKDAAFGTWTPSRIRQFRTLTHPEHLGRPFSVLVQGRGEGVISDR